MTQENQLQISLQEATHNYINKYLIHEQSMEKEYYDVYKKVLGTYFPDTIIQLCGTKITLIILPNLVEKFLEQQYYFEYVISSAKYFSKIVSLRRYGNGLLFVHLEIQEKLLNTV